MVVVYASYEQVPFEYFMNIDDITCMLPNSS